MDNTERRTLILASAGGMFISTVFIIAALCGAVPNMIALVATMFYVSFFEIGLGPIPWLIVAEMFDSKYVKLKFGVCSVCTFTRLCTCNRKSVPPPVCLFD